MEKLYLLNNLRAIDFKKRHHCHDCSHGGLVVDCFTDYFCFFNHYHIFDVQSHTCVLTTCVINPLLRALLVEHQGDSLVDGVYSHLSLSNGVGRCMGGGA